MTTKSIFKSRTAVVALITAISGALGMGAEPVREWLSANAPAIMLALGLANIFLRRITRDAVTIFPPEKPETQDFWWN